MIFSHIQSVGIPDDCKHNAKKRMQMIVEWVASELYCRYTGSQSAGEYDSIDVFSLYYKHKRSCQCWLWLTRTSSLHHNPKFKFKSRWLGSLATAHSPLGNTFRFANITTDCCWDQLHHDSESGAWLHQHWPAGILPLSRSVFRKSLSDQCRCPRCWCPQCTSYLRWPVLLQSRFHLRVDSGLIANLPFGIENHLTIRVVSWSDSLQGWPSQPPVITIATAAGPFVGRFKPGPAHLSNLHLGTFHTYWQRLTELTMQSTHRS